ncbi:hypothetical protein [Nioella aestuarii]|uniref:hypothetical protein n=1 Tax=Nioella aestuarii TaxID=1662864 RepID=UPI003D7FA8C4
MDANYNRFQERLRRLDHSSLADDRGVVVLPDGLVVPRRRQIRLSFPWRSLALAVICCFLLKGFMIWHQGEAQYSARLADLSDQTAGHQAAAWILSMDPVSSWIGMALTDTLGRPPV